MKAIDYLRVAITDRCNFRCTYCMPPQGIAHRSQADILSFEEIAAFTEAAVDAGITRVRITGGEPLVRRDCSTLVSQLAAVPGVRDLSLTTNGALLAQHAGELRDAGLSRVNISIASLDERRFFHLTRGGRLKDVLAGLHSALEAGLDPVKVNVVMLDGIEHDVEGFVRLAREYPVHVRFIEFMPIGGRRGVAWEFVPRARLQRQLQAYGVLQPAEPPPGGGPARYYLMEGAAGTLGFISSLSDHFCSACNRLRLTADGYLRNCLFSADEVPVRHLIKGDRNELVRTISLSISSKAFDRRQEEPGDRIMSQIGG